jgi:hypothetical protein
MSLVDITDVEAKTDARDRWCYSVCRGRVFTYLDNRVSNAELGVTHSSARHFVTFDLKCTENLTIKSDGCVGITDYQIGPDCI